MKDDIRDLLTSLYAETDDPRVHAMTANVERHRPGSTRIALLATELRRLAGAPPRAACCCRAG
jgi:hypothetical protein